MLETGNVYTFRVANDATKTDIKKAFAELYDRSVSSVQIAKNYSKVRNGRKGQIRRRAAFKKHTSCSISLLLSLLNFILKTNYGY